MKLKYILPILIGAFSFTSCNDFLDREPLDNVTPEAFFWSESDLAAYTIKQYSFATHDGWNLGTWKDDNNTDNQVTGSFNNRWVPGEWRVNESFSSRGDDPWNFDKIRNLNYFLEIAVPRWQNGEIKGTDANIKHYIGEAYFMRAWQYLGKLQTLGDFPIVRNTLPDEQEALTEASHRRPRNEVARFIISDLDSAIMLLNNNPAGGKNRITRNAALLVKSRTALFEASWETYHKGTNRVPGGPGWPGASAAYLKDYSINIDNEINYFLDEAMKAAAEVADNVSLTANNFGKKMDNPYYAQFAAESMEGYEEILLWRAYDMEYKEKHSAGYYLQRGGGNSGFTRDFVETFLCEDGLPIYASSNYVSDNTIAEVKANRDFRLQLFMKEPGELLSELSDVDTFGWVLFLHAQKERVPSLKPETAWTFHLDDRDSSNYTMQWVKRDGKLYSNIKDILDYGVRPLHVYGHKEIFYRVRRMLYQLARHYRFDETVIGVQLGNEEGFSFLDESDFNPVTAELYKEWMHKTNKTDYAQFKKEAMDWWWQQFTSAYHEGDPYKIISFNLDAAQAEAGDPERVAMTGTSASTYADGNLDVIGTMFYKGWGYKAILGLDHRYNNSYNYQLPILIPSEIGIGRFNSPVWFRHFIAHTLERAAQGFGVYCYGEVRKELPELGDVRNELIRMLKNISLNEDIIWEGLPGPGTVSCQVDEPGVQVSHLNKNGQEILALIYFPEAKEMTDSSRIARLQSLKLNCKAQKKGHYKVDIYKNGECIKSNSLSLKAGISRSIPIDGIRMDDIVFVSIRQDICNKNNNKGKEL